jgi:1-aminocyclopropane-1-carboxylate deaminase/D-cysteine desulfhydrase-like pyridoxal-dependent ACC family enzyme
MKRIKVLSNTSIRRRSSSLNYLASAIPKALKAFRRAEILRARAPIYHLRCLSASLGTNVYVLRDDLTGFALGGNKTRKLEFLVGDALRKQADTLITTGASSFSRNAAAAGKVKGLDVHVILAGSEAAQNPASQAHFRQFETVLHYDSDPASADLSETYERVLGELNARNRVVYELHPGGSDAIGSLGYVDAFQDIVDYSQDTGIHFNKIILATGSAGTQVGLVLGQLIAKYDTTVIGIAASKQAAVQRERVCRLAVSTAEMLGVRFDQTTVHIDDGFLGPGYALPSEQGRLATDIFASTEGILLDDVYTAKAAAALIEYAKNEEIGMGEKVLFVHTGGNAGIYY